ncbi:vascular endothelial growth factor A-like [Haliotis rubra]|uniref:vascular endothelial growth factor A-like n=1 Tax=Haliotis rubra TaxID=36100 RepID=UPI001EE5497A|nr:vascular endothelial growth factor A-like [Haliotis rubra]
MILGVLAVWGICLFQGTLQMNYHQAMRLSRVTNITELFRTVDMKMNGRRVELEEVLPNIGSSDGRVYVSAGAAEFAFPDECSPRLMTVDIPRDPTHDVNVMTWPTCTRVRRCGGCCANNMLHCVPLVIRPKRITVLKTLLYDSNQPDLLMEWDGTQEVTVDEHLECDVTCRLTADDCNKRQRFDSFECSCTCRRHRSCYPYQRWDIETCECVCIEPERQCEAGLTYSPQTCSCIINRFQQYSNLETDDDSSENANPVNTTLLTNATSSAPTTPPPTTTTTTMAPTTVDPCATQFCPPGFLRNPNGNGGCVCTPNFTFNRK